MKNQQTRNWTVGCIAMLSMLVMACQNPNAPTQGSSTSAKTGSGESIVRIVKSGIPSRADSPSVASSQIANVQLRIANFKVLCTTLSSSTRTTERAHGGLDITTNDTSVSTVNFPVLSSMPLIYGGHLNDSTSYCVYSFIKRNSANFDPRILCHDTLFFTASPNSELASLRLEIQHSYLWQEVMTSSPGEWTADTLWSFTIRDIPVMANHGFEENLLLDSTFLSTHLSGSMQVIRSAGQTFHDPSCDNYHSSSSMRSSALIFTPTTELSLSLKWR